jgi:galacturonosyltransferase
MTILILTNHSYMLWQFRRELIGELLKKHRVCLCMPFVGHEDDFAAMGAECIPADMERRGTNPFRDLQLLGSYRRILKKIRPDLVLTYSIKPNIYGGLACRMAGIPYYANVQGLGTAFQSRQMARAVTFLYRRGLKGAGKVFFENRANAEEFVRRGIVEKERQVILHGAGVNLDYFACTPYPRNEKFRFLYLGRIMREKGMDELFAAVRRLKGDFILDLAGFFEEGYEEQVRQLEEEGLAVFHGFQKDPRPFYAMADCVVMPSYHEGMSNVNLEAAASGRPVITSDIPGCREAVEDRVTGILCRKRSTEDFALAMQEMMDRSPAQREAMGLAGRQKMEREFDRQDVIREALDAMGL